MRGVQVVVRDFTGPITQLKVQKRPGMEHIDLLDSGEVPKPGEVAAEVRCALCHSCASLQAFARTSVSAPVL